MDSVILDILTTQLADTVTNIPQPAAVQGGGNHQDMAEISVGGGVWYGSGSHKLQCTPEEARRTACLNGGVCFAMPEADDRRAACLCPSNWTGRRCEENYIDLLSLSTCSGGVITTSWGIAALAALCCVLLGMGLMLFYFVYREQKRRRYSKIVDVNAKSAAKHHPLVQQISYSNYHGVRVLNNDQPIIDASSLATSKQQKSDQSVYNSGLALQGNIFSSFVNSGSDDIDQSTMSSSTNERSQGLTCVTV